MAFPDSRNKMPGGRWATHHARFVAWTPVVLLLVALAGCRVQDAAESPDPAALQAAIQVASGQFNSGDSGAAFETLDSLLASHPESPQLYTTLGQFKRQTQEMEASLAAFKRASELAPAVGQNRFNLAVAHALMDQPSEAFAELAEAKSAGFNVLNVFLSPAAAVLGGDARLQALFPTSEEYAAPFVEGTRIIHDWSGEAAGDQFGWVARNVGDVDGDGVDDAASSATTNSDGAPSGGKIYVYSGRTGALIWSAAGEAANGQLGFVVEAAGDVNRDGTPDVVAGAPYANQALIYSGIDGSVLRLLEGPDPRGAFGASVRGVGDLNQDGYDDVLVGEPFQIWGAPLGGGDLSQAGSAHVFSGRDGSILVSHTIEQPGAGFGSTLAGADGVFVIGAPAAGERGTGQAFVYQGLVPDADFVLEGGDTSVSFGAMFMSILGDANGDGVSDYYVSDWADAAMGPSTGRIYVFSGADGSLLFERGGEAPGDGFGIGVSNAGDIDGDGLADLIVGAWQHAGAAPSGGKLYAMSGLDGTTLHTVTGRVMGETLGFDTTGLGDVDGDGSVDFLVTSAWSAISGFQSGRTLVISGRNP